ncbi:MAG TPA: hypothetical protein V6C81_20435 [Planktothrix sp.]|jgi:hypothetical protein
MTKFLVRVELRGEDRKDSELYKLLHTAMEKQGFVRYLKINSEKVPLPHATYKLEADINVGQAKQRALDAVEDIYCSRY